MSDINIGAISEVLNNKMDLDGNNASASFRNTSNWSNNITNCITYIPQDIKVEIGSSNQFIVKGGSKVYYGDGSSITLPSDKSYDASTGFGNEPFVFCIKKSDLAVMQATLNNTSSNATNPGAGYRFWFNTTDGKCYMNDGSGVATETSFPVGIAQHTNNVGWTSIEQVFNGFGYTGSAVFVLPGVKGLVPYYRNSDGTMKNIQVISKSVNVYNVASPVNNYRYSLCFNGGVAPFYNNLVYNEHDNRNYTTNGVESSWANVGEVYYTDGKISKFNVKEAFHAVDYSDFKPVQDHSVIEFQAPTSANNYMWYRKYADGWVEQGGLFTNSAKLTQITFPVVMADTNYSALSNLQYGSSGWSATVTTCIADGTRTTTGLQILCYYNSSYNTGPICWEVKGMAA